MGTTPERRLTLTGRRTIEWAVRAVFVQHLAQRRALILAALIVLTTSGCASSGLSRPPGLSTHDARHRGASATDDSWFQAGADSLAAARQSLRSALHRVYQSWAGTPYQYGGQSRSGVDCSSFVQQAIGKADDFQLPRTTVEQARVGMSISKSHLKTGDLVFFKTGRLSHHVGIYLGQGRFMHASTSQGVTISRLDNVYWRHHYWQSRRIIADTDQGSRVSSL